MIELIRQRLITYSTNNNFEEENALKEIVQEIILYSLWRAKFFELAAFQGGTSLRILHGLQRFSEDIDFILLEPDPDFTWRPYLNKVNKICNEFGIESETLSKGQMDQRIKKAIIKDNSIANQLNLAFITNHSDRKIKIKLEIDCTPPAGSGFEHSYLDFPVDFEVCHQDLSSNFALKIHALLCRPYLKGRDWYDFSWYISLNIKPNLPLLQNALNQFGPWKEKQLNSSPQWLNNALNEKIVSINWKEAASDVERFLNPLQQKSLTLWNKKLFMSKLDKLQQMFLT